MERSKGKPILEYEELGDIDLHVAGATVGHKNPFENLEVPRNSTQLSETFIEKWVLPFYMARFSNLSAKQEADFLKIYREIDSDIVNSLLGDFNWRTRIVGAYFSALCDLREFEDIIGNHFLKSEVCFAGNGYCLALASFGTPKSKAFLERYLKYYLTKVDLNFDQSVALSALYHIDEAAARQYESRWKNFISDKPSWDLTRIRQRFSLELETIKRIKSR